VFWGTYQDSDTGERKGQLLQQIIVTGDDSVRRACIFKLEWPADVLRQALESKGIHGGKLTEVYAKADDAIAAKPLLKEVFGPFHAELFDVTGGGESVRRLGFENTVGADYFRALAKMALHFALAFIDQLDGHAWELDRIRRFIRYDERPSSNPVTRLPRSLSSTLTDVLPKQRGHIFSVQGQGPDLIVKLQCFFDPAFAEDELPPSWKVRLGRRPSTFLTDVAPLVLAAFHITQQPSGHDGEILRLRNTAVGQI